MLVVLKSEHNSQTNVQSSSSDLGKVVWFSSPQPTEVGLLACYETEPVKLGPDWIRANLACQKG